MNYWKQKQKLEQKLYTYHYLSEQMTEANKIPILDILRKCQREIVNLCHYLELDPDVEIEEYIF